MSNIGNLQVSEPLDAVDTTPAPLQAKVTSSGTYTGLDLPGVPGAVGAVRSLLRQFLGAHATHDLLICASELATNTVVHTRSGRPGGRFLVSAEIEADGVVLVSVLDEGTLQDCPACPPEEHGRGLGIVEALSIESGSTPIFAGRLAWFRISVTDAASRDARTPTRDGSRDAQRDGQRDAARDGQAGVARDAALAGGRS
jgi:anti-sigma regulatory factor (Ser/Thr protein kinase)